ncbi:hypothetical protein AQUCO_00800032v1 [Aquilegia coerulea]|uniref:Uncharacterized protein n=1 Tax=Aquilegia coerulea TaxID=218851 RepID=A0A2G5EGY1_AQUCA|nr:hypothetical protein AQUCO_00800032v1 [Aquilegia coerulea]
MGSPDKVQVLEKCRVAPPKGSISSTSLPLTFLDLPWLVIAPVDRLFFYEFEHSKAHFMNTILPNIKHSLSLTLQQYYPLAGNLTWSQESTKPEILYTIGDSVSLTVAECDRDFYNLTGNHARDANEFHPLVPTFAQVNSSEKLVPAMALQVTLFPYKGICIGIKMNHVVADGRTSNHFMKSWATLCRLEGDHTSVATESFVPLYDRSIVKDPKEIEKTLLNDMAKLNITSDTFKFSAVAFVSDKSDNVQATFVIGQSDVKKLKEWISTRLRNEEGILPQLHLSTFVLACAYVWVCLIKAEWVSNDDVVKVSEDQKEQFAFAVDGRSQLNPPVPITYFGNCLGYCLVKSNRKALLQDDGIAIAAELIAKGIQKIRNPDELWTLVANFYCRNPSVPRLDPDCTITVAGSPKLNVYETDFGWGKPKKVEVISIRGSGAISLTEYPHEEGALEIGLVRTKKKMDAFSSLFINNLKSLPSGSGN